MILESSLSTQIRPVFDAPAQEYNGVALNDCLETEPDLVLYLAVILIRFRRGRFAITADIAKVFLQLAVTALDQDVHRFLWDDQGTIQVMKSPFGNRCSPIWLTMPLYLSRFPYYHRTSVQSLCRRLAHWL